MYKGKISISDIASPSLRAALIEYHPDVVSKYIGADESGNRYFVSITNKIAMLVKQIRADGEVIKVYYTPTGYKEGEGENNIPRPRGRRPGQTIKPENVFYRGMLFKTKAACCRYYNLPSSNAFSYVRSRGISFIEAMDLALESREKRLKAVGK